MHWRTEFSCWLFIQHRQGERMRRDPHAKQSDCVWSEWTFFVILFGNQFRICFCWQFPPVVNVLVHFSRPLCSWKAGNLSPEYDRQSSSISSDMGDRMKKKRLHLWKQRNWGRPRAGSDCNLLFTINVQNPLSLVSQSSGRVVAALGAPASLKQQLRERTELTGAARGMTKHAP